MCVAVMSDEGRPGVKTELMSEEKKPEGSESVGGMVGCVRVVIDWCGGPIGL